jgi:hypothetical protein
MDTMPENNAPLQSPPPLIPEPEMTPELPLAKPKKSSAVLPMLFGVLVVLIISSVLAGTYYFSRLKKEVANANPSPIPTASLMPSIEPAASASSSATPFVTQKPSSRPTTTPKPTPTPAPSQNPITTNSTIDIRFSNPSAHVKQTLDEGSGDGRVINREFSSIQAGEFDEIRTSWSPRVTVCFHVTSNQDVEGNKLGYTITEDDKVLNEGTLAQYSKLEAGKTYDVCHDTTTNIGAHKLQLTINNTKSVGESTYANNTARIDFKNNVDNVAPNYALFGPNNGGTKGTCFNLAYLEDNVTPVNNLKVERRLDGGEWTTLSGLEYCVTGTAGSQHTLATLVTDARGNKNEQSSIFNLY